jgi:hypothetical protein
MTVIVRDSFKFEKGSQPFIATNNKLLSVVAVRVRNEDCFSVGINRCNTAPTPPGFAEIVSDYSRSRPLMNWGVQRSIISTGRNVRDHAADWLLCNHATRDRFHAGIARFVAGGILLISCVTQEVQAKQRVTLTCEICL